MRCRPDSIRSPSTNRTTHTDLPTLVAVARVTGLLRKLVPGIPTAELRRRADAATLDVWGGPAVATALAAVNAAIVAATVAATSAAVAGGASS